MPGSLYLTFRMEHKPMPMPEAFHMQAAFSGLVARIDAGASPLDLSMTVSTAGYNPATYRPGQARFMRVNYTPADCRGGGIVLGVPGIPAPTPVPPK